MSTGKSLGSNNSEISTTWYSWVVATLCMLTYAVSFISRNVWSTAIPIAAPELNLSMTAAGGLMTAYYIGYVISNFFSGFFVDSLGPRKTLTIASLLTGFFTLLIPFTNSYPVIFLLRVGAGIASGPLFAGGVKFQHAWFSPTARATAMGFVMTGPALGMMIASGAFAPIIQSKGWQIAFTYAGFACLVVALATFLFAKEKGTAIGSGSKSKSKKSAEDEAKERKGLLEVLTKRSFILGSIAQLLAIGANQGFTTWIILYLTQVQNFSLSAAGAIVGGTSAAGLISSTLSGIISDVLKTRKKTACIGAFASFIFTVAILYSRSVTFLFVVMFIRIIAGAFVGNSVNTLQSEAAEGPYAGRAMGIYNGICQLGSVIFPSLLGIVLDSTGGNFFIVMMSIAITYLIIGFIVLGMEETMKIRAEKN
ncbi:MFS transporter [Tepidanaerobacter syntrophicus]|uniref:MFS transporter n=1 Tax=Tepidanaerobacter syntrophicus TaxID=224999 RepID=UPI001BD662B3|nr:MFS transporter [Tepidanaerobacter syntrophicus]